MGIFISHFGDMIQVPPPPPPQVKSVNPASLTDDKLKKLIIYRGWVLDGTPQAHNGYADALRLLAEATDEQTRRRERRAIERSRGGVRGHDPSLCDHPVYCTGALR